MKKVSKSKKMSKDNTYIFPPKTDFEFRIHMKTNTLGIKIVVCFELPSGEQHIRNYGCIPSHSLLIPYEGQKFDYYLDEEYQGKHTLTQATCDSFTYEKAK